ncbi:alpha-2-macroglobulin family protein [Flavobacterium qiangtangense]|uniref:Alpha-2-macroglobulin family protein n=1 Tax=Flavobacterium qiangtangense TaxID=1442595 RepID=A0ABW1PLS7_9FLAO
MKIYKLKAPDRILGSRAWNAPDIQTISEEDFIKLFPYEPYFNENEITKWTNQKLVFSKTINTEKDKKIILDDLKKFESGNYKLFFKAKDSAGKEIETTNYFKIYNKKENIAPDKQLFNLDILNKNPKKDGFLDLKLSSSFPLLYINVEIFYDSGSIFNKVIKLNKEPKIVRIPINKNWPNNLKIETDFVLENRTFDMTTEVDLSEIKETLNIETKSIRNKIEPGSIETWSFSIQNNDKKGIESEALANMYDSSLDQFANQTWPTNLSFNNYDDNDPDSKTFLNFGNTDSYFKNLNEDVPYFYASPIKNDLNWFGFDFVNPEKNVLIYKKYLTDKVAQHNGKYITGVVSDLTGPLPGATVNIAGTTRGAQTDIDGEYKIKALFGETLIFSYLGYDDSSITINDNTIDATLIEGVTTGEVVVTGALGIKKKLNAVGSSYFFEENEITTPSSALQMLTGRVSGVQINTNPNEDYIVIKGSGSLTEKDKALIVIDGKVENLEVFSKINPSTIFSITTLKESQGVELYGSQGKNGVLIVTTFASLENLNKVETRKNLAESAFFLPQLKTDSKGNLSFNFTSPEALTKWKLQIFAHNKKAVSGYFESLIVTQKDIMVIPNLPRFLREKDTITITTKIANMTSEAKSGMAMLQLFDAISMEPIDAKMLNSINTKSFQLNAKGNTSVSWKIYVPEGLQGVQYKIVAKAGNFSDGEENILPVLTNNMLVTESIPVWVRENSSKEYTFENLKNNTSTTLRNQQLTFEYTSNPTWLAIQALPYLMEYEHECAEQTFARYYANALASEILNSNPKIAAIFESWNKSEKPISKLEQNEELKSILLSETPWITDALSEEEKKKNLATLFDLQKMKDSQKAILEKLTKKQKPSGGFAWFDDGEESEYITRHIISGLGHLQKLSKNATGDFDQITKNGISFLDQKFLENHKKTEVNNKSQKLIWMYPYNNLHYLYARSLYLEKYPLTEIASSITQKYTANIKENWLNYSLYEKGLASLILSRFGEKETAKTILESLRQTSSNNENWGMYWIENKAGWHWYQAPIETQALLIEAFAEIENDKKSVDAMKVWLLKNKQNKNWPTTKATTEAVYALLMQGNDWISVKDKTVIKLGDEKIVTKKLSENEKEAGTGYIKMNWKSDEITKEMATVSINNKSEVPGFGGFYWQYFEELDKIKSSQEGPMTIEKELYLKATTSEGNQLQRITSEKSLKIGDLVTVRLVISTKEDMEFVHLKDMRASCFEPIDVLSKYKWQDGLGYYQSTKDVATHFFFDRIKKGKFVLEYDIRVNNLGDFSNGITTIQSMYAPEFSSHTKGIRIKIKE